MTLARAVVDELNLQGAQVSGQANVELTELTCDGSFDGFTADDLSVDLSAVNRAAPSARLTMLQAVADTAREAGDLDLANEATYRRFVELNRDGPWIKRAADMVFYRGITGYLVKPLRPLAGLLVLLLIGTTVRFVASGRERVPRRQEAGFFAASPSDFASTCDRLGVALGETGRAIVRPRRSFRPVRTSSWPGPSGACWSIWCRRSCSSSW